MKPRLTIKILIFLITLFTSVNSFSANTDQNFEHLAQNSQWLDLLHYHRIGLFSSFESQADDPDFFLSPDGKSNPYNEIKATITAFLQKQMAEVPSKQCEFPARLNWLKLQLGEQYFPKHECEDFDKWFAKIDAKSLTLIFPAAYLNSPSSMFGHTLIRINRLSGKNPLLDFSVNYAANADPDDNELVFSYKGLAGGYPGVFTILPYYQKVKEYSFLESRDVWEYELKLSTNEVKQFIRHIWEVRNTYFDYYFADENCSYQLLTILDAASSRFHFSDQFKFTAIPADTVRVISQSQLIGKAVFRPSTLSLMKGMIKHSSSEIRQVAKSLVEPDSLAKPVSDIQNKIQTLPHKEQAQALELAYQYSRYLSIRKKQQSKALSQRSVALLSARSKIPNQKVFPPYPKPEFRDDQGHLSKRVGTYFGTEHINGSKSSQYAQLSFRMAYHDLLDPVSGYIKNAKLEMFNLQVRHNLKNDQTRLQDLRLIDIASFSPRDEFVTPTSWRVSTGLKRFKSTPDELVTFLSAGAGFSYQIEQQLFYSLLNVEFDADNNIEKGYRFATGPRLGWLTQHNNWSANVELNFMHDLLGAKFEETSASLGLSYNFNKNWQIRLKSDYHNYLSKINNSKQNSQSHSLALMTYF